MIQHRRKCICYKCLYTVKHDADHCSALERQRFDLYQLKTVYSFTEWLRTITARDSKIMIYEGRYHLVIGREYEQTLDSGPVRRIMARKREAIW